MTGCFPSNPKSEVEQAIDKDKKALLVGTWVLQKVDGQEVSTQNQTRISFSENGIARNWLGAQEREGKWVFTDSAKVVRIQEGNVGETLKIRSLTDNEFIYTINVDKKEIELIYKREE